MVRAGYINGRHSDSYSVFRILAINGLKPQTINNYISGICSMSKWLGIPYHHFQVHKVSLMLKALKNTIRDPPKFKTIFHIPDLVAILLACEHFQFPLLYKTLYLFAFFGFFRISNLVPTSSRSFDLHKQLCRGDVIQVSQGLVVLVKWSKTL